MKDIYSLSFFSICILTACIQTERKMAGTTGLTATVTTPAQPAKIYEIPLPQGYKRVVAHDKSFAGYLRNLSLKKDNTVFLYDGRKKSNQSAQYAVIDVSVGTKDLQQCADAIMRLKAEYLYQSRQFQSIEFFNGRKEKINYSTWLSGKQNSRKEFMKYMEHVFNYCGTASLPYSLKSKPLSQMSSGDILLKPGSPGNAVLVMDMAQNANGKKIYLLAQSYMPAQDIHILKNPMDESLNPWYELNNDVIINTPEWIFYSNQLYEWK